jgi:primase-like protein
LVKDGEPSPAPEWVLEAGAEQEYYGCSSSLGSAKQLGPRPGPVDTGLEGVPIPEGTRNQTMFRIACSLRGRGLKDADLECAVLEICPHGRPIAKRIKLADLLREFGRL